jgi:hypothetical protein
LVLGTAKDLADALRGDLHQYRRLSNVSSTTTTAMQKPEALALASQLRPPISQPEINTLKKLSSKQRKRLASTTLIELQTIPFLEPSLEASLLVVASFALHDIRRQQQFEVNNDSDPVLRADGVMSDWTKLHRNNTTATQNNINKLFADIRRRRRRRQQQQPRQQQSTTVVETTTEESERRNDNVAIEIVRRQHR